MTSREPAGREPWLSHQPLVRVWSAGSGGNRARMTASTFKPVKDRRKSAPVKRLTMSVEARRAYEDTIRQRDERERDHTRFLPDDRKGKR